MFKWLQDKWHTRHRRQAGVDAWRQRVLDGIVNDVIPSSVPYYYDSTFSFLQRARNFTRAPVRLTLFFPTLPLAIDVVGVEGSKSFADAAPFISRSEWEVLQADLSLKVERFEARQCPYLVIRDTDPVDPDSLRNSIKVLTSTKLK